MHLFHPFIFKFILYYHFEYIEVFQGQMLTRGFPCKREWMVFQVFSTFSCYPDSCLFVCVCSNLDGSSLQAAFENLTLVCSSLFSIHEIKVCGCC